MCSDRHSKGSRRTRPGSSSPGAGSWWARLAPDLGEIVRARAEEVGAASLWVAGQDFGCASNLVAVGGRVVTLWTPGGRYEDLLIPLHGAHQGANAAVALAAAEAFFGDALAPEVVEEAFAAVRVPGRLEVLGRRPLLLVDGAHNAAGMAALGCRVARGVRGRRHHGRRGRDADAGATRPPCSSRSPRPACMRSSPANRPRRARCPSPPWPRPGARWDSTVYEETEVRDAVRVARGMVDADGLVVVAGSLYVVGAARADALASSVPWEDAGR